MEHLLDFQITKVYEPKKDGELIKGHGEYGDWQLFTFHTDKTGKEKFSFMWGEKKPVPVEGLAIKHMEYEEEKKGQYTNLNVKKLELSEKSRVQAISNAKEDMGSIHPELKPDKEVSYWVRYMTDIAVAILSNGGDLVTADLDIVARKVGKAGLIMMNESLNNGQIPSQDSVKGSVIEDKSEPIPKAKPKSTKGKGGPSKVICDYEEAPWWGQERITMFCKNQCEFKDSCSTAKQLREGE